MIERLELRPYALPLRRPWASAHGAIRLRRGLLVRVEAKGLIGYGDCAPLPEAGTEPLVAASAMLERWAHAFVGCDPEQLLTEIDPLDETAHAIGCTPPKERTPAAHYALACALADLLSQQRGICLRCWLNPAACARIAVNAALGPVAQVDAAQLADCIRRGLRVIKLKVGIAPLEDELAVLRALERAIEPGLADRLVLRLDANGAWGLAQAHRFIEATARLRLPIESLEEPLADPDPLRLAELQSQAPFALALDESLIARFAGCDPRALGVRRLVLKPAAIGGLRRTLALARHTQGSSLEVVITSLIDSAAGLWPTAQLAGALANPLAHGLGTGAWLARDLGTPPLIQDGWMALGDRPGSGFSA
ncbi:o-succinylbenzoate synthase [Caldichromatium japonicum]|uniref:o-succinylbenzoate synthase n=1 Tax=Caldichromatium japonicum TaxID=2699430 RepID=A0A6G7VGG7_9GAMM|nr:o-succinylbenzoate synthase [Caldichromatium japonicum]